MKKENLIFIEEALKHREVVELVSAASEKIWYKVPDVTAFEHRCYRNIGMAIMRGDVRSIIGLTMYHIRRAASLHIKSTKYETPQSLNATGKYDDEGNKEPIEVIDVLADVEQLLIEKESEIEKVALLAQDDDRKKVILRLWTSGVSNTSEISRLLAQSFGGNKETHRKFINRFKLQCQKHLANAV